MRRFFPLHRKPLPVPSPGRLLPVTELVDEEICPYYDSKKFYPAKPGEVLDGRYQVLFKVGWGVSSTTWLARDMRGHRWEPEDVVALKITNTGSVERESERAIEECIATADRSQRGYQLFRTSLEHFEVSSPEGRHLCLAYELMREPLWLFQRRFKDGIIPLPIIKTYIRFFLIGLDYLHTTCNVVHTDLKLENIMISFEDPEILNDFMDAQLESPMEYKIDSTGRPVYRCHNDFGPLRKVRNIPKIVDFCSSINLSSDDDLGVYPIQPDHYRAPEVILGCGWNTSADIWNLGVLLYDLIQGEELFRQVLDAEDRYTPKAHLAEMIALLGPPPPELVSRTHARSRNDWPEAIQGADGRLCETAEQYFDGPFFDGDGNFLFDELIPNRTLTDVLPPLDERNREGFFIINQDDAGLVAGGQKIGPRIDRASISPTKIAVHP
ncbi:kinase-like domain-containing protein [Aspergillus avenaceus]|uniref:non-specific serine/threonine protein kinase n=1 Tax=Aspergillus avenaceus TaxID=36643 RepID=A0A5N6U7S9_ASPAV|nr:kinase-like domain-containing protein [Aspergillus avenaceus]